MVYPHGVGSHAVRKFDVVLHGDALRFISMIGIDDVAKPKGSAIFEVYVDGKLKYKSPVMHGGENPRLCDVSLKGAKSLILRVSDAGDGIDYDHADWAGAMIVLSDNAKKLPDAVSISMAPPRMVAPILSPKPEIHSPRIIGTTPGRPFIFLIPATGRPPLTYKALNLPKGLRLNPETGVITGSLLKAGSTIVKLTVQGPRGVAHGSLEIVGGPASSPSLRPWGGTPGTLTPLASPRMR
jgi:alpha-galactosidase